MGVTGRYVRVGCNLQATAWRENTLMLIEQRIIARGIDRLPETHVATCTQDGLYIPHSDLISLFQWQ